MAKEMNLDSVVYFLNLQQQCRADLLARMPFDRRQCRNFIKKHQGEIEARLGRKLSIQTSEYIPSGRGAFGRAKGGNGGKQVKAEIRW